ncbi:MAG: UDP-N-acetylmuramate dehydrogenase [Bacteroidales bacterium]|nr:UDP-N-acetylmuramate dehydrogenase [Bacteroidales bacterium]
MKSTTDASLLKLNTFGLDARASRLVTIEAADELRQVDFGNPYLVLGGGSNMVFAHNFDGTVLHMANRGIAKVGSGEEWVLVEAQAGEEWDPFVRHCAANGWHGLENLAAIPGTVGAAPVQNVGAYGAEAADCIESVSAYNTATAQMVTIGANECRFGYRDSLFKHHKELIVTAVTFRLSTRFAPNTSYSALRQNLEAANMAHPTALQMVETVTALRWDKLPRPEEYGSAGSFFKNPVVDAHTRDSLLAQYPDMPSYPTPDGGAKLSAAWLIDRAGWKGRRVGNAAVWQRQPLVLYNAGGCTGNDITALASAIATDVEQKFGVGLTPEAIII